MELVQATNSKRGEVWEVQHRGGGRGEGEVKERSEGTLLTSLRSEAWEPSNEQEKDEATQVNAGGSWVLEPANVAICRGQSIYEQFR